MYAACRQMFDTATVKVRTGDALVGRLLLNRLASCARMGDCPHSAECNSLSCRLTETASAA